MVAKEGEPSRIEDDAVEFVAMDDQQTASIGGLVNSLGFQLDAAEVQSGIIAEGLVMIARDVDDPRSVLRLLEHAADDVVVAWRPVPAFAELPAVDDVADQVERLAIGRFEEIEQQLGLATARPKVRVRNPDCPDRRTLAALVQSGPAPRSRRRRL